MTNIKFKKIAIVLLAVFAAAAIAVGFGFAPKRAEAADGHISVAPIGDATTRRFTMGQTAVIGSANKQFKNYEGFYYTRDGGNLSSNENNGIYVNNSNSKPTVIVFYTDKAISMKFTLMATSKNRAAYIRIKSVDEEEYIIAENNAQASKALAAGDFPFTYPSEDAHTVATLDVSVPVANTDYESESVSLDPGYYTMWAYAYAGSSGTFMKYIDVEVTTVTHTITFNTNGGTPSTIPAITVADGDHVADVPDSPIRSGFAFHGWHIAGADGSDSGVHFDFNAPVTKDENLIAVWYETTGKTEITSFEGFSSHSADETADPTERIYDTTVTVQYSGQSRSAVRAEAVNKLPKTVTGFDNGGGSHTVSLEWEHRIDCDDDEILDEIDPIIGDHYYVATMHSMPEDCYTVLWLRAKVTVVDIRETVLQVLDNVTAAVEEGVNLDDVLPQTVNVRTNKQDSVSVSVSWEWAPEDVSASSSPITVSGTPASGYSLGEGVSLTASVTVKKRVQASESKTILSWSCRDHASEPDFYSSASLDDAGDRVFATNGGFTIAAKDGMTWATNKSNYLSLTIVPQSEYIKFVVTSTARIGVRASADSGGNRTFVINDTSASYSSGKNYVTKGNNFGASGVFDTEDSWVYADVEAGTYYFWCSNDVGNKAQVYEISIGELGRKYYYSFTNGEKFLAQNAMIAPSGDYTFVGWANQSGRLTNAETAPAAGNYSPVYAKLGQMVGSVRIDNPGIRFGFRLEMVNGDAVDLTTELSVTLKISATREYVFASPVFGYSGGAATMNAVVTGFGENNAWNTASVTATASFTLCGVQFDMTGTSTAKEIAQKAIESDPSLADSLAIYLAE